MKCGVGPKVTFHEDGKVERSDATPIRLFSYYGHIFVKFWDNFEGSGITPSYFPALMKWSLLVLLLIALDYLAIVYFSKMSKKRVKIVHRTVWFSSTYE